MQTSQATNRPDKGSAKAVTVQSGRPTSKIQISAAAQQDVEQAYLTSQRQRFKVEVVRLTKGGMAEILTKHGHSQDEAALLGFLMSYVFAWHWLQRNIHADYQAQVLQSFMKGKQGFLMQMLLDSESSETFIRDYFNHWLQNTGSAQSQQVQWLVQHHGSIDNAVATVQKLWDQLGLLQQDFKEGYKDLAREEKERYAGMLDDADKERLALVDAMPDVELAPQFDKMGIIPAMGCPQTCRHCMFIFRPMMKKDEQDSKSLYQHVNGLTRS
ncbi:MAG: hypothetical protein ACPGYX_11445, partial [Oceanobacter sp.]